MLLCYIKLNILLFHMGIVISSLLPLQLIKGLNKDNIFICEIFEMQKWILEFWQYTKK